MSVLGLKISHLLLIHTNLGCGTILMAACTHQGCSASDYYYIIIIIILVYVHMHAYNLFNLRSMNISYKIKM
jgi:hypothetical protein